MNFPFLKRREKGNRRFRTRKRGSGGGAGAGAGTGEEHQLPLKVPPSRKEVSMRRQRIALRVLLGVSLSGAFFWVAAEGGDLWRHAFHHSGDYAVGQFELVTNGVITVPQVVAATGLRPDQNITEIDLGEIRAKLMELPRVSRADVERRLPNHLSIRLEERRPVAWLACAKQGLRAFDSRGLMLDAEGVAFPCGLVREDYGNLPVINCPDASAITPGRQVPQEVVRHALDLAQRLRRKNWSSPMALEQINIENDFTLVAQMNTDAVLTFLPTGLDRQLARLDAILLKTASAGRRVATVNLQLSRNVPVTLQDTGSATASVPQVPDGKTNNTNGAGGKNGRASGNQGGAKRTSPVSASEEESRGVIRGA